MLENRFLGKKKKNQIIFLCQRFYSNSLVFLRPRSSQLIDQTITTKFFRNSIKHRRLCNKIIYFQKQYKNVNFCQDRINHLKLYILLVFWNVLVCVYVDSKAELEHMTGQQNLERSNSQQVSRTRKAEGTFFSSNIIFVCFLMLVLNRIRQITTGILQKNEKLSE